MLKSTAISILRCLDKEDISRFEDFLKSPYFNKKNAVTSLFAEIRKYYPELTSLELDKERLWAKLYPGKEYNYGVMKNLIHELTKLVEQFIAHEEFEYNKVQVFLSLYSSLCRVKLKKNIDNKEPYFLKHFNDETFKDSNQNIEEYYHQLTKIYRLKMWHSHLYDMKVSLEKDRVATEDCFVTGMLPHLINIYHTSTVLSFNDKKKVIESSPVEIILRSIPPESIESALNNIRKRSEIKYELLQGYYLAYRAFSNPENSEHYFVFKEYLLNYHKQLPEATSREMERFASNCVAMIVDPLFDKSHEEYELFKFKQNTGTFIDVAQNINTFEFARWLVIIYEENEPEELEEFVTAYGNFIVNKDREMLLHFAHALKCYLGGDYRKSLSLLTKTKSDLFGLNNIIRKFTLMLYYELDEYESFLFAYDSHKHFLDYSRQEENRKREIELEKTKEFCKRIDTLFKFRDSRDRVQLENFEKQLKLLQIEYKKWFLRKIDELKKASR